MSTNDLRPLVKSPGRVRSTVLTTPQGKMVDWGWAVTRADDLLLVTSNGRAERVREWLDRYTILEDVRPNDESSAWRRVTAQGSAVATVVGLDELPGTGTTSERGLEPWWRGLPLSGEVVGGLVPVGEVEALTRRAAGAGAELLDDRGAELRRVANGVPGPEHEFADEVNPLELRLAGASVSFDKGCYIGQEVIARLDTYDKLARVLMGFDSTVSLPAGVELKLTAAERPLGRVTSVVTLPSGGSVGLAVIKREAAAEGEARVEWPGGTAVVQLRDRPFWKR